METEIKLALDAALSSRLRRHPLLLGTPAISRRLLSLYFDTPDYALQHRRVALRVRRVGRSWIQTVKAEAQHIGALSRRPEWETRVRGPHPDLDDLPEEVRRLFDGVDPARLAEVFQTDFRRTTWQLMHAGSQMELALDSGQVRVGELSRPISEVEIELRSGPVEGMYEVALQLNAALPMQIEPRSKGLRGYLLCGAVQSKPVRLAMPALSANQQAGEVWRAAMSVALNQFNANLPGYWETPEDLEYLHQIRVAVRRLRSLASLCRSLGILRPVWSSELRTLMTALNPARDWDVFFAETLPAAQKILLGTPLSEVLLATLHAQAARARRDAQSALDGADCTRLVLEIEQALLQPIPTVSDVGSWAGQVLDHRWKVLRREAGKFDRLDEDARHAMRLHTKKMRYSADLFIPMAGRKGKAFAAGLAYLQDRLGMENDAVVARRLLTNIALEHPALSFDAGRLAGVIAAMTSAHTPSVKHLDNAFNIKPFWHAPTADD